MGEAMTTTATKERPILFSGPMVRAILDGKKTQTRRVIAEQHTEGLEVGDDGAFNFMHAPSCGGYCDYACAAAGEVLPDHIGWSPYGRAGAWNRLWVREAWCLGRASMEKRTDVPLSPPQRGGARSPVIYRAQPLYNDAEYTWKPSIFMPRWASRITLEITGVRVERLNRMSFNGWKADFCPSLNEQNRALETFVGSDNQKKMAAEFWDGINAKRGYPWSSNPWVWVIEFKPQKMHSEKGR